MVVRQQYIGQGTGSITSTLYAKSIVDQCISDTSLCPQKNVPKLLPIKKMDGKALFSSSSLQTIKLTLLWPAIHMCSTNISKHLLVPSYKLIPQGCLTFFIGPLDIPFIFSCDHPFSHCFRLPSPKYLHNHLPKISHWSRPIFIRQGSHPHLA